MRTRYVLATALVFLAAEANAARSCPFCNAVAPTFAERRAECTALALGEAVDARTLRVVQVFQGKDALAGGETINVGAAHGVAVGRLALLLGTRGDDDATKPAGGAWSWEVLPVDEVSLGYYVRMPEARRPVVERLRYAAKYLEHVDPQVADDAFREFGRAPYDAVAAAADALPYPSLRRWLVDPQVPGERKGVYGLALGLARDEPTRRENVALLRRYATSAASEFRAGFDGVLGGLLVAEGTAALDLIDERFLRNPQAAEGDVRHAQAALRFYVQYGRDIPAERLTRSTAYLLDRPGTAAAALADLTRMRDWSHVERAVRLFVASTGDDPALDRAVVGYLLVCPKPEAAAALRTLRASAGRRTAEAERHWSALGVQAGKDEG